MRQLELSRHQRKGISLLITDSSSLSSRNRSSLKRIMKFTRWSCLRENKKWRRKRWSSNSQNMKNQRKSKWKRMSKRKVSRCRNRLMRTEILCLYVFWVFWETFIKELKTLVTFYWLAWQSIKIARSKHIRSSQKIQWSWFDKWKLFNLWFVDNMILEWFNCLN